MPFDTSGRTGLSEQYWVRLHLYRMDQVGKLDGVLDEEDRDVVAHQIPVAFPGVQLDGKAAHIARCVAGVGAACYGGNAGE